MGTPRSTLDHLRDGQSRRSTFDILMSIADDTRDLVKQEVALARSEIVAALIARGMAAAAFAGAGLLALLVLIFGALSAADALDYVMPAWASRLVVAGGCAVLAGIAVLFGKARISRPSIVPEETKRSLKEAEEWARAQLQR